MEWLAEVVHNEDVQVWVAIAGLFIGMMAAIVAFSVRHGQMISQIKSHADQLEKLWEVYGVVSKECADCRTNIVGSLAEIKADMKHLKGV